MTQHNWGDEEFDWMALDNAIRHMDKVMRRWRIQVRQSKEKWGQARIYCSLGLAWWPQLTHPGYQWNPWPKWARRFAYGPTWLLDLANVLVVPIHKWAYLHAYRGAVKRWPHIKHEIMDAADFEPLLDSLLDKCTTCNLPKSHWDTRRLGVCHCL